MKTKTILPLLAACLSAGCAAPGIDTRGEDGAKPLPYSRIPTQSRWVAPSELEEGQSVVVALIDLDFSGRATEIVCTPASFRAGGDELRLAVFEAGRRVKTIAALRDALAERTEGTPIGLVVQADGKALGAGAEVSPPMQQFLRYFVEQLDKAGVEFTILAPSRVNVVRARDAEEAGLAAPAPAANPESERSAVYDTPSW